MVIVSDTPAPAVAPDHPTLLPAPLVNGSDGGGRAPRTTRDWFVDVVASGLAVASAVFVYWLLYWQHRQPGPIHEPADIAFTALSCTALWWRRRWPVAIAVAIALGGLFSAYSAGASLVALFTVAVHRRFAVVAAVAALSVLTAAPYALWFPDPTASFGESMIWAAAVIAMITAWGMFARARRQLVVSLRDRARRAEQEQHLRADQARRAERARIAREMHDVLAHRISLLATYAGALEFRKAAAPEEVSAAAGVIRASAHEALEELRAVIGVLRAGDDPDGGPGEGQAAAERPQPTAADLPALVEESAAAGTRVSFTGPDDLAAVPSGIGRAAYRIVQEGLTNARKHAPGAPVTVTLGGAPGAGLTVEVRNRLPAAAATASLPGAGAGLVGMTERAALSGGHLECGPTGDGDFVLRASLPWQDDHPADDRRR